MRTLRTTIVLGLVIGLTLGVAWLGLRGPGVPAAPYVATAPAGQVLFVGDPGHPRLQGIGSAPVVADRIGLRAPAASVSLPGATGEVALGLAGVLVLVVAGVGTRSPRTA